MRSPASDGLPSSTTTPTKPTTSDSHSRRVGRMPLTAPSTPIHSGIIAHTIAAPLDATVVSAVTTKPLPQTNSKNPAGATRNQSRRGGSFAPRRRATTSITAPAVTNRRHAVVNGGISRTAIRAARYVEPQITNTAVMLAIRSGSIVGTCARRSAPPEGGAVGSPGARSRATGAAVVTMSEWSVATASRYRTTSPGLPPVQIACSARRETICAGRSRM